MERDEESLLSDINLRLNQRLKMQMILINMRQLKKNKMRL